jgi:hypothetical protein
MGPHQHTPVDYEVLIPVLSPTARNEDEAAEARDGNILRRLETGAEWFAPPSRSAGTWQGRPASPPRTMHSTAGRVTGPSAFVPPAGGQGHAGFPVHTLGNVDLYGSGQPLPPPLARQLTGSILRSYNTVALDAIQAKADRFPHNGSVKARNALFLDTELRSGSMLTGFLGELGVTTLARSQIDLNGQIGRANRSQRRSGGAITGVEWCVLHSYSHRLGKIPIPQLESLGGLQRQG